MFSTVPHGPKESPVRPTHIGGSKYRDCLLRGFDTVIRAGALALFVRLRFRHLTRSGPMRVITGLFVTLSAALASLPVLADGGHLHARGGHSHWTGFAALGAVIVLALLVAKAAGKKTARDDAAAKTGPDTAEG
jgi:hypothetical protein